MTRRDCYYLLAGAVVAKAASSSNWLAMEGYIFQQYAQRQGKRLAEVLPEVIPMARAAGFRSIELNREFFTSELASRTLELIRANGLAMPSVYLSGPMHVEQTAKRTTEEALRLAKICEPFGCTGLVMNADPKPGGIEKTPEELATQVRLLDRAGRLLSEAGFQLRVHNHTPEMLHGAREWRNTLRNTDPRYISFCLDIDWIHQGGQDVMSLLKECGDRVSEIHARNSNQKVWLESFAQGDVDYGAVALYLKRAKLRPLVVVELAYHEATRVTRPLPEDLLLSRVYAEKVFAPLL